MTETPSSRDQMIVAAAELFARGGFNGVTTKAIAKRANVSDGNIFRYFPTKRDLYIAAVDFQLTKLRESSEPLNQISNNTESRLALHTLFELIRVTMVTQPELTRLLHFSILEYGPDIASSFRLHFRPIVELVAKFLRRSSSGSDSGDFHESIAVLSFIATIASLILLNDVLPDFYGSQGPYDSVESATADAARFWSQVLSPQSTADQLDNIITNRPQQ